MATRNSESGTRRERWAVRKLEPRVMNGQAYLLLRFVSYSLDSVRGDPQVSEAQHYRAVDRELWPWINNITLSTDIVSVSGSK
jgi:hypothetical protein